MSRFISITSGSKPILENIFKRHPDHNLKLYKSSTENTLKLIDWFTSRSVFKLPLNYQVVQASNQIKTGPFINLIYLTLDNKERKLLTTYVQEQLTKTYPLYMTSLFQLQNKSDPAKVVVGSSWTSNRIYVKWLHNSFICKFSNDLDTDTFSNNLILL